MLNYSILNSKTIIHSDFLEEAIYNLLDTTFVIPKDYKFNIFTVTEEYISRPDLISLDAYDDTSFADIICKLNGISNPFELNEGVQLIIPSPEDILNFIHIPESVDIDNSNSKKEVKPKSKKANEKRKANEAIVGDDRFRIDAASRVIIY